MIWQVSACSSRPSGKLGLTEQPENPLTTGAIDTESTVAMTVTSVADRVISVGTAMEQTKGWSSYTHNWPAAASMAHASIALLPFAVKRMALYPALEKGVEATW